MRTYIPLHQFLKDYKKSKPKKSKKPDKYFGLQECMKNAHKCNATKLLYY